MAKSKWRHFRRVCSTCAALIAGSSCTKPPVQTLECHIQYADKLQTHAVDVAANPYAVPNIPIEGRFELRAVYVTEPSDLAGLNVYVYQTSRQRVLLHQLKLQPPYQHNTTRFGITGLNFVYDETARELQYWCGFAATRGAD